jgi:hypothetical protein
MSDVVAEQHQMRAVPQPVDGKPDRMETARLEALATHSIIG